ncbi:unnamed protein product, partial [Ascophyllum nodosum]
LQDKLACFALDVLKDEGYGTTSSGRFRSPVTPRVRSALMTVEATESCTLYRPRPWL